MNATQYKEYFSGEFRGMNDAIDKVFTPIFGEFTEKTNPTEIDYADESHFGNGGANIDHIYDYGTYYTDSTNVSVFEVVLSDNCQISRARKNIQNTVRKIMGHYAGAFIIFHYADGSNNSEAHTWRLSWLKRLDKDSSSAKRYTYLCGPSYSCRTIAQRLDELQKTSSKTLDSITKAFDVEALSDEFFKEYKVMYDDIVQWITGQRIIKKDGKWELNGRFGTGKGNSVLDEFKVKISGEEEIVTKAVRDYVKKLLGRLVFIQFLQKKEWLKIDGTISSNFLLDLFNVIDEKSKDNFIEAALERVVYLLLNNENRVKNSEIIDHHRLEVPFLNGGLFERDQYDNLEIKLPKEFFHNETYKEEKRELSETRLRDNDNFFTQCGILDLFNQYNFTIDENDPNDAEMGVDPEMLGKIFENLLEDNKDKGAFYTPKEIVQYMCNESLIAYLQTKLPNHDDEIRQFVLDAEQEDVPEKDKILNAIKEVKICDPAIGSGAFPMGLLNLLVALREKLESSTQRVELKKSIIQNNIYGVDIEKGAIDIARLRFWLSIMVDEEKPTPLPNFEYKFMQGNSLLTTFDLQYVDIKQAKENRQVTAEINKKKQELYNKKNDFYKLSGEVKYKKEVEIKLLIVDILKLRLGFEQASVEQQDTTRQMELFAAPDMPQNSRSKKKIQEVKAAQERVQRLIEKLLEIEKQLKDESKSWEQRAKTDILFFNWEICFAEIFPQDKPENERGFDIVIGNPPYFVYEGNNREELPILREQDVFQIALGGKLNAYKLFLAHSLKCLVLKDGINCFIFQNSFMADLQAANLRKYVLNNCQILMIDSFPERDNKSKRVFESVKMSVCILLAKNSKTKLPFIVNVWDDKYKLSGITTHFSSDEIEAIDPENLTIPRLTETAKPIVLKMIAKRSKYIKCWEGELNVHTHRPLFSSDSTLPIIMKGAGIQRYYYTFDMSQGQIEYLQEKEYLNRYGNSEKAHHHDSERIVMQGMTGANDAIRLIMSIIPQGMYLGHSCKYIMPSEALPTHCLLGLFNSNLFNYFFRCFSTNSNVNGYEIEAIPICDIPNNTIDEMVELADQILSAKKANPQTNTTTLERKIDVLVYLLYGLTWDEVQVVENSSVHAALPVNEVAYTKWLERYQKDGTLPSEKEMEHMA